MSSHDFLSAAETDRFELPGLKGDFPFDVTEKFVLFSAEAHAVQKEFNFIKVCICCDTDNLTILAVPVREQVQLVLVSPPALVVIVHVLRVPAEIDRAEACYRVREERRRFA